ncbi:MAG: hypothetical protein AAF267_06605 [Deinococcota bacterium]
MNDDLNFSYGTMRQRVVNEYVLQDTLGLGALLAGLGSSTLYLLFRPAWLLPAGLGLMVVGLARMLYLRTLRFDGLLETHLKHALSAQQQQSNEEQDAILEHLKQSLAELGLDQGAQQIDALEHAFDILNDAIDDKFASGSINHNRFKGTLLEAHKRILVNLKQAAEYLSAANDIGTSRTRRVLEERNKVTAKAEAFVEQNKQLIGDLQLLRLSLVEVPTSGDILRTDDDAISKQLQDLSARSQRLRDALKEPI